MKVVYYYLKWYKYIIEYILRILQNDLTKKSQKSRSKHWLWPDVTFCKIREEKGEKILRKFYIKKLKKKWKIVILNIWFLEKIWIYYDLLIINNQKNPEWRPRSKSWIWLTKWYPNLAIHIWIKSLLSEDSK